MLGHISPEMNSLLKVSVIVLLIIMVEKNKFMNNEVQICKGLEQHKGNSHEIAT